MRGSWYESCASLIVIALQNNDCLAMSIVQGDFGVIVKSSALRAWFAMGRHTADAKITVAFSISILKIAAQGLLMQFMVPRFSFA